MKRFLLPIALVLGLTAPAPAADFTITIDAQKVLDALPDLCTALRERMGNPTPWNANLCMRGMAIYGIKNLYADVERHAARVEMRNRIAQAARALEESPLPTPTATPSPTPSQTPVP